MIRALLGLFIFSVLFIGCGSSDTKEIVSQTDYDNKSENLATNGSTTPRNQNSRTQQNIENMGFLRGDKFDDIRSLIYASKSGELNNVTYICVGDSTRAESVYNGEYLFYEVRDRLDDYNINSLLLAKAGHTAQEFDEAVSYPTYQDVIDEIDGDGNQAIVDISLGINDYWEHKVNFKRYIEDAIAKIKRKKPKTHFILTIPNRIYNDREMTNDIRSQYIVMAKQMQLPLIDVVKDVMPSQDSMPYSYYRNDGFNCHLSKKGQHMVAQDILKHILPID